jgi:hypothetical protein
VSSKNFNPGRAESGGKYKAQLNSVVLPVERKYARDKHVEK